MNFIMNTVRFVKSFSRGQITIPKDIRDWLGISEEFWLKLSVQEGKIIAEPAEEKTNKSVYAKKLLKLKGDWLNLAEIEKNRNQIETQINKRTV